MKSARVRAFLLVCVLFLAVLAVAFLQGRRPPPQSSVAGEKRPRLMLLTSLPLIFGEGFQLHGGGSPALNALQAHYAVVPISTANRSELGKGQVLLMAHPLPQTPDSLVQLDDWIRRGGRVLLLADPMLVWPSGRSLGDPLRPPAMFMDTGLLAHWGLRLDAPDIDGPAERELGGHEVMTVAPGTLHGGCKITADRLVARCRIGRGEATIVADADFLNVDKLGPKGSRNLDGLLGELAALESPVIR